MRSGEQPMPEPLNSAPLAAYRLYGRSQANIVEVSAFLQYREQTTLNGDLNSEIDDIVHEIFKEDLSDRAQARQYLWEFFD